MASHTWLLTTALYIMPGWCPVLLNSIVLLRCWTMVLWMTRGRNQSRHLWETFWEPCSWKAMQGSISHDLLQQTPTAPFYTSFIQSLPLRGSQTFQKRQKLSVQAKRPQRDFPWSNSLSCTPGASSWELVGYANPGPHPDSWIRNSWGGADNLCFNKPAHFHALWSVRTTALEGLGQWWMGAKGTWGSGFSGETQELAQSLPRSSTCRACPGRGPAPQATAIEFWVPSDTCLVIVKQ